HACDVRESKKGKPYIVCDPCGVQLFIRGQAGIERFVGLVKKADAKGVFERVAEMERRYMRQCLECEQWFWISHDLLKTSWVDGEPEGYKCPRKGCGGFVKEGK